MPAFDPNPTTASTKAPPRTPAARCPDLAVMAANDWLPAWVARRTSPTTSAAAPNWVITAYHWPADATSGRRRWSTRTRSREVIAISSHRNRNVVTFDAAGTRSRVVTNMGRTHDAVRLERPWPR